MITYTSVGVSLQSVTLLKIPRLNSDRILNKKKNKSKIKNLKRIP